jgi:uncharacterized membrane protein
MSRADLTRLQDQVGRLLRHGARLAAVVLAAGLGLWVFQAPAADTVLSAGLIILMAIPVTRIAASLVEAIRQGDRLLVWSTVIVLAVMAGTLVLSLASS